MEPQDYINIAGWVISIASVLANATKTDKDNKAIGIISKIINIFAFNFKRSGIK